METKETVNKFAVQGKVKTIKGTITMPEGSGLRLVLVATSESGKPDSDLYSVLNKKWKQASAETKGWFQNHTTFKMGHIKDVAVQSDVWLVNMLFLDDKGKVNSNALTSCLKEVCKMAKAEKGTVHCSTLLTKAFPQLQGLLTTLLVEQGVSISYYEEPTK